MKKVLFATTALVMTAGVAAAEVAVTGDARLGLRYETDTGYTGDESYNVVNRARVHFTMTGESDAGLTFGANVRADQAPRTAGGNRNSATAGKVWVSGEFGRLDAGDVDGALESAVGDLPEVGVSSLDWWNEFAYATSAEQGDAALLYTYSIGNANIYASLQDQYEGSTDVRRDDVAWSLGVGYDLGDYTFGLGYERGTAAADPIAEAAANGNSAFGPFALIDAESETWGISGGTSFQGVTFKAIYLNTNVDDDDAGIDTDWQQYGIGAEYTMANGVGLQGFWRKIEGDDLGEATALGLGASYDLGGGATLRGGIVDVDVEDHYAAGDFSNTLADVGLSFRF